jgi:glycosyltransferase involved in cell wall biosynthesis
LVQSYGVTDIAIVGQDPGFAGGVTAQTEALWQAAVAIGREPELHYLRYRSLDDARSSASLQGRGVTPLVPGLDVANVVAAAGVVARRVRRARTRLVCAAVASHGFGAVLARKPYGYWIGTTLGSEAASKRAGVGTSRRMAHAVSAPGLGLLERTTLREAKVRWTTSHASRQDVVETAGIPESSVQIVPIPVDLQRFMPVDNHEWEGGLETPQLIFVGRADDPRKNIGLLLEGFARLRERLPTATLKLVGAPPRDSLPPGVEAAGYVESVAEILRHASLFVLPSHQEGFGIVVAEALASGVPVIVTPCGGPEELVRESGGGEVLSGFTAEELAERALALLEDATRLATMRRLGRAHVVRVHDPANLRAALVDAISVLDGESS